MRLSITIELTGGKCQSPPASVDHRSVEYPGPLATFIAQLAAAYLRAPAAGALQRLAQDRAIVSYQTSSPDGGARLDRSV